MTLESVSARPEPVVRPRKRSLLDLLFVVFGKFSTIAVVLVGGMIVARLGGKNEYAIFVTTITAALLLDSILGTAFDLAVVRYGSLNGAGAPATSRFQALSFYLKVAGIALLGGVCGVAFLMGTPAWLADFPVWPTLLATAALLVARSVAVNAQIHGAFRVYSGIDFGQGISRLGLFALLALIGTSSAGMYLAAYAVAGFAVLIVGKFVLRQEFLSARCTPDFSETNRLLKYAGVTTIVVACGALTGRGDFLLLSLAQDKTGLAEYGAASQIAQLLCQFSLYASVLTQPRVLKDLHAGTLHRLFLATLAGVAAVAVGCVILWNFGALRLLVSVLFGDNLSGATMFLPVLLAGGVIDLLLVPVPMTLGMLEAPRRAAIGESILAVCFFAAGLFILQSSAGVEAQMRMAWLFTGIRVAKLLLYGAIVVSIVKRYPRPNTDAAISE